MHTENNIPTLEDVAKAAGVSTATVSRCLNLPDQVAKPTLNRVMKTVQDMGYTPNFGARAMAAKRTFTIGAIIPTMENAIFARGLQAFQEELHARGYTLLVSSTGYQPDVEQDHIRALVSRGADALLLIGYDRDPSIYEFLEQRHIPALVAWAFAKDHALPSIGFDNRASMYRLARHVIGLGHRDMAVISGITKGNDRAAQRLEGIKDAIKDSGHDPADLAVIETSYAIENGALALDRLMASANRPTVVMCGNDVLAVGALLRAKEIGLKVPDDLSITGFDDIELARIVSPQLTTIHVPHREMGLKAARELVNIVEKITEGTSIELQTTMELRASLQAPGK
ncbi:MAG: LacI family DNA-binding transcriptional regulator [Sulfitobacter sp.]